jgi:hypothetical protein
VSLVPEFALPYLRFAITLAPSDRSIPSAP